jgi:hypothetical protein
MNTRLEDLFPFCCQQINESKQKQFEVLLNERIRNTVKAHSLLRRLGEQRVLEPGEQARYKISTTAMILPQTGGVPLYFTEFPDEIFIPVNTLGSCMEFDIKYVSSERLDICNKAISNMTEAIIDYEEEGLFRVLVAAATYNTYKQLKLSRLDKKGLKKIIKSFESRGRTLTHLLVSKKEISDLQAADFKVPNSSPTRIVVELGEGTEHEVEIIPVTKLGLAGRYNINHMDSTYGIFKAGPESKFNQYKQKTGAIVKYVNETVEVVRPGETQIYALSLPDESTIKVPIRKEFELFPDPALHRQQKLGYYGWEEIGVGITDITDMQMIVIDRS